MDYFLLPDKIKSQLPLRPGAPSPLVVSAAGGLYATACDTKVTVGGCG